MVEDEEMNWNRALLQISPDCGPEAVRLRTQLVADFRLVCPSADASARCLLAEDQTWAQAAIFRVHALVAMQRRRMTKLREYEAEYPWSPRD